MAVLRFRLSAVALRCTIGVFPQSAMFGSAPPRLAAAESSSTARACVRKVELIGDVDKNGGATRGDAPAGDEQKKARQKLLHLNGGGKLGRVAKKFGGESSASSWAFLRERSAAALRVKYGGRDRAGKSEPEAAALTLGNDGDSEMAHDRFREGTARVWKL